MDQMMITERFNRNVYRNKVFACILIGCLSFFVIVCVHFEDIENYFGINRCLDDTFTYEDSFEPIDNNLENNSEENLNQESFENKTEACNVDNENNANVKQDENQTTLEIIGGNKTADQTLMQTLIIHKSEKIEHSLNELKEDISRLSTKQSNIENELLNLTDKIGLMDEDILDIKDNQEHIKQILAQILANQQKIQIDVQTINLAKIDAQSTKSKSRKSTDK